MSDRSTKVNLENDQEQVINPATEDKQDDIIDNQTNGLQKTQIVTDITEPVSVQNPFSTDGDSIYAKDVDVPNSDIGSFTGDLLSLFNDYGTEITDITATNPKTYTLRFKRPLNSNKIALGSRTGDFSNVKISLKDLAGTIRTVVDDSTNNTKFTSNVYQFTTNVFIEVTIEFHTTDAVTISGMFIPKVLSRTISSIDGYISETNTSKTPLTAGFMFTGTQVDTLNYGMIILSVFSDVDSATDGVSIQFRSTNTGTWRESDTYTILAGEFKTFTVQTVYRFMRIMYTNGITDQTVFDLQTTLKPVYVKPSSHRIDDVINGQDDAELSKSNLIGKDQNGNYQNVRATEVGNLMTSSFLVEVARDNILGYGLIRKFGTVDSIQSSTPADVWAYGITAGAESYTFSADGVADIDRLSSDNPLDTGILITITGLDIDGIEVEQTIALDGTDAQTPVVLTTPLWRVNRAFNANGTDLLGNVYIFVNGATTGGIPDTVTDVRGFITIGDGQTLQSIYTVPAGKTAYFMGIEASLTKAGGATAVGGSFKGRTRQFGKVFRTQDSFDLISSGSSNKTYNLAIPLPFLEKTDFVPTVSVTNNGAGASWAYTMLLIDN